MAFYFGISVRQVLTRNHKTHFTVKGKRILVACRVLSAKLVNATSHKSFLVSTATTNVNVGVLAFASSPFEWHFETDARKVPRHFDLVSVNFVTLGFRP